jgi:hypothetical protein
MPELFTLPRFSDLKENYFHLPNNCFLLSKLLCETHDGHFSAPLKISDFVQNKKVAWLP